MRPGHEGACPAPFLHQNSICNKGNVQLLKPYTAFCFADQKSLLPWELQNESITAQPGRKRNLCQATTAPGLLCTSAHMCSAWKQKAPSNLIRKPPPTDTWQIFRINKWHICRLYGVRQAKESLKQRYYEQYRNINLCMPPRYAWYKTCTNSLYCAHRCMCQ